MARSPSLAGVILAAGGSMRMGRDKALLPWHGQTFLAAAIDMLKDTELVIVVAGRNADALRPIVDVNGAFMIVNPEPEHGQFSSLQLGVQEVMNRGRDAAMVALVDRPPVSHSTITQLHTAFENAVNRGKWAVIPSFNGKHGHPLVIGREMITAFLKAPMDSTARDIEHDNQQHIEYVAVDDPHTVLDVDTPEDYEQITDRATQGS